MLHSFICQEFLTMKSTESVSSVLYIYKKLWISIFSVSYHRSNSEHRKIYGIFHFSAGECLLLVPVVQYRLVAASVCNVTPFFNVCIGINVYYRCLIDSIFTIFLLPLDMFVFSPDILWLFRHFQALTHPYYTNKQSYNFYMMNITVYNGTARSVAYSIMGNFTFCS
jgi:hypothetical protein